MLTSAAIGAGDRWPVGCALLVAVLLSLLLWAILWILLWRLFGTEGVADFQQNIKRRLVIRSCFSPIHNGRRGIAPLSVGHQSPDVREETRCAFSDWP
jgi:hypothetical protein